MIELYGMNDKQMVAAAAVDVCIRAIGGWRDGYDGVFVFQPKLREEDCCTNTGLELKRFDIPEETLTNQGLNSENFIVVATGDPIRFAEKLVSAGVKVLSVPEIGFPEVVIIETSDKLPAALAEITLHTLMKNVYRDFDGKEKEREAMRNAVEGFLERDDALKLSGVHAGIVANAVKTFSIAKA